MRLAETRYDNRETGCCARLDVTRWDGARHDWQSKPFVKDHIHAFLHVPLNFGSVMAREHELVESAAAYPDEPPWLVDEVSPWGSDVYLATDRDVSGAAMEHLTGTFLSKVFEGPYRDVGKWIAAMEAYVAGEGRTIEKLYFYYATCPKCARHYGKNQVVVFAKVG